MPDGVSELLHNGVAIPASSKTVGNVRVFATAGSFAPSKATPLLVEAFMTVAAIRADLRLTMLGDGVGRRRCEDIARSAGGRVEFPGFRADVDAQLRRADAFVLPSFNENLPLALLQAMVAGLPCIASDVGGEGRCSMTAPASSCHPATAKLSSQRWNC